jgi:chromosomal replication initiator protein
MEWLIEQSEGTRSALGLLQNLGQSSNRFPGPLDRKTVQQILAATGQPTSTRGDPQQIVKRVAEVFRISEKELLGTSRLRTALIPRQVAMYLSRETTKLSLPRIATFFAGRDHTTVLHACRKLEAALDVNEALAATVRQLRNELS